MSCLIRRDDNGRVSEFLTPQGTPSKIYEEIHTNPFIGGSENSATITSIAHTKWNFKEEPTLVYQAVDGVLYNDMEELLLEGKRGFVNVGFEDKNGFQGLAKFTVNSSNVNSFLADQIEQGLLSAKIETKPDGSTVYFGKGEFSHTKVATATFFKEAAKLELGIGNVRVDERTGEIDLGLGVINEAAIEEMSDGTVAVKPILDIDTSKASNSTEVKAAKAISNGLRSTRQSNAFDENSYMQNLTDFLASLGFSTTTLEQYRKSYNTRFGQDPDIQAISDIANRVVAFAQGEETMENMSEEVAHIAIEAYSDKNSIAGALAIVHLTPEYGQYSDYYRTKYAPFFDGIELEDQIRKEVLGKILAAELLNNFQKSNRSEESLTLMGRIREIWDSFVQFIQSRLKPSHQRVLDNLNRKLVDAVMANQVESFNYDLSSSNAFFYSAMSATHKDIQRDITLAKTTIETALKAQGSLALDQAKLDRITEDLDQIGLINSINTIVGIADRKAIELERAIKGLSFDENSNEILEVKDENTAIALNDLMKILNNLKSTLPNLRDEIEVEDPREQRRLEAAIDKIIQSIEGIKTKNDNLQPKVNLGKEHRVMTIISEELDENNMREDEFKKESSKVSGVNKDISAIGKFFTMLSESQNPILRAIASRLQRMNASIRINFALNVDDTLAEIYRDGLDAYQKNLIQRDAQGNDTGYYFAPIDYAAQEREKQKFLIDTISTITGKDPKMVELKLKTLSPRDIIDSEEKMLEFREIMAKKDEELNEKPMLPSYYESQRQKQDALKIAEVTRSTLRNISIRRGEVVNKYRDDKGRIDNSKLTQVEKDILDQLKRERKALETPYDSSYEIYPGLKLVPIEELTSKQKEDLLYAPTTQKEVLVLEDGSSRETISEDARIALDISTMNGKYLEENVESLKNKTNKSSVVIDKIKEMIREGKTSQEVFSWVRDNSTIGLSDSYYENMGTSPTYIENVEDYIETIEDEDLAELVSERLIEYKKLVGIRKAILKQNKKSGTTLEIAVSTMPTATQNKLKEIEERLESLRKRIQLPMEDGFTEMDSEVTISSEFIKKATEAGMNSKGRLYKFALQHMTETKRIDAENFSKEVEGLIAGTRGSLSKKYQRFFQRMKSEGKLDGVSSKTELADILKDEYGMNNLASYYKVFTPKGFNEGLQRLENDSNLLLEYFESGVKDVDIANIAITPDYTWLDAVAAEDFRNPNYKAGMYYLQPKARFLNDKWFERYGISKEAYLALPTDDISQLVATKNQKEFRLLQLMIQSREKVLEAYNDSDRVNKWLRPQITKSLFEDFSKLGILKNPIETIKEKVRDFTQDREDEKLLGETVGGEAISQLTLDTGIRVVPKYYQQKIDAPISENIISSAMIDVHAAITYNERIQAERDVRALRDHINAQRFTKRGASKKGRQKLMKGEVSNTKKVADEFIDANLYGIQQSRPYHFTILGKEFSLMKILGSIQKFSTFSNLGFNFFVDATGITTGVANKYLNRVSGEYFSKASYKRATAMSTKMVGSYMSEYGKIDKKSELNKVFELLGIVNPADKVKDSGNSRAARAVKDSGFVVSQFSNLAISPDVVNAVLIDTRYYDGAFINYDQFKIRKRKGNQDILPEDIETQWANIESESLYNHLDFTGRSIKPNSKFAEKGLTEDDFAKAVSTASQRAQQIIMRIDMVIPDANRVAGQRDAMVNGFLQHRGWAIINFVNRFKGEHYNSAVGVYEEGMYTTLGKLAKALIQRDGKSLKDSYTGFMKNGSAQQIRNVRKARNESAFLVILGLVGMWVIAADDDEDSYIQDVATLIYLRTFSEMASVTAVGIPKSFVEIADSPIPMMRTLKILVDPLETVPKAFEEDKDGNNKLVKDLIKNSPLRRFNQYADIQQQIDAYRYYNDPTLFHLGSVGKKKEDDSKIAAETNPLVQPGGIIR